MEDDLPKIDRWHSEPLDVHTWSDHPEIKALCDDLYDAAGLSSVESKGKGNRKAQTNSVKESLRVLDTRPLCKMAQRPIPQHWVQQNQELATRLVAATMAFIFLKRSSK